VSKVFSVNDFKEGLDVRKSPLTAPGGSLRILDNAVITPGGEIEKRLIFDNFMWLLPEAQYIFGQGGTLHVFGIGLTMPISGYAGIVIVGHSLEDPGAALPVSIIDVEAFNDGFYVIGHTPNQDTYIWWNGVLVHEADGSESRGTYARTYKTKMYRTDGGNLRFSGVNDPGNNDPASTASPGAGFINMAVNDPDGEAAVALEVFYNKVAVFARLATQLWTLDPDPTLDNLEQVIRIGTLAARSVHQFGTGDILFLSDSGVRSLKSQTVTITAAVSDVGSAIDPILTALIRTNPDACAQATATVQPVAGRYWLAIGNQIFVLSYFPAGDITAWSTFSPGFQVYEFAVVNNRVFVRGENNRLCAYGGVDNQTYDDCQVHVRTPHMAVEEPTQRKRVQSVDVMCQGAWSVSMGMLPNNTELFELVANVQDNTFGLQSIPFAGYGTHIGLDLVHQAPGPALLAAVHLNIQEASIK
jgi:hypothetical protein